VPVPHHVQFEKDLKQNKKARLRNRSAKSRMNTAVKKVQTAPTKDEAAAALLTAVSIIDSTARKGIIKKETAARKVSRLTRFVNQLR
jgi:small subunit ribosomal protein S20